MKRHLFSILFLSVSFIGHAQYDIHFEESGLDDAIAKSRVVHKPVFFMGFASWCQHCKNMKEEVFTDSAVANFYNSHFVCVKMDMEQGDGVSLSKKFGVKSYPTFVFLDTTGNRIYQAAGEFKSADFIAEGNNALTPEKQLPYLKQQYESSPSDSDKCYQYLRALRHASLDVDQLMVTYFATQREDQLLSLMNYRIISLGVTDPRSREIQFLLNHQKQFADLSSPAKVERKIYLTAAGAIEPAANNNDTATYFKNRKLVSSWHQPKVDSLIFNLDLMLYENHNNYTAYRQTALSGIQQYAWNDYAQLRHIADVFFKYASDVSELKQAATWAKRSADIHPEYGNTLLSAKLLEKSGDVNAAKQEAQQAIEIAAKSNANASEADQLLKRLSQ